MSAFTAHLDRKTVQSIAKARVGFKPYKVANGLN